MVAEEARIKDAMILVLKYLADVEKYLSETITAVNECLKYVQLARRNDTSARIGGALSLLSELLNTLKS